MAARFVLTSSQAIALPESTNFIRNVPQATAMCWHRWASTATTASMWGFSRGPWSESRASARITGTTGRIEVLGRRLDADALSDVTTASTALIAGVWTHVAVVYDFYNRPAYVYINGSLTDTLANFFAAGTGNCSDTTNRFSAIASAPEVNSLWGNGDIEDVRVYNRRLSADEIKTIANCRGRDGIVLNLQGRYLLNENADGEALEYNKDCGPFGRHGTSVGSPTGIGGQLTLRKGR